jgi:putative endonuclease
MATVARRRTRVRFFVEAGEVTEPAFWRAVARLAAERGARARATAAGVRRPPAPEGAAVARSTRAGGVTAMAASHRTQSGPTPAPPAGPAVYLLHLEGRIGGPRHYARHYLGEARDLARRLREHGGGRGSKLLAHAKALGVGWWLVRWWPAPADAPARRALERRLKARHGPSLCPLCVPRALRHGTLVRRRVAAVAWPRPRRFGQYLASGEAFGGRAAPTTLARPFLVVAPDGEGVGDPWDDHPADPPTGGAR